MSYLEALSLLWKHCWGAFGMALLFGAGMLLAIPVHRRGVRVLLYMPDLFACLLGHILKRTSTPRLAAFIFLFNAIAIFLYMLTGVIPYLPAATALSTGLNVALTSIIAQDRLPLRNPSATRLPITARIGAVLTFVLELPCLWLSLAMGMTITPNLLGLLRGDDLAPLRARALAYALVIVPTLALSALAEAHAVHSVFHPGHHPPTPPASRT